MGTIQKSILIGVVAAVFFFILFVPIQMHILVCGGIALVLWFGLTLIFNSENKIVSIILPSGLSEKEFNEILEGGRVRITSINVLAATIRDSEILEKVKTIIKLGEMVYNKFEKDKNKGYSKEDARTIRRIGEEFLDSSITIIEQYVDISDHISSLDEDGQKVLKSVPLTLDGIIAGFQKNINDLLKKNVRALKTEMKVVNLNLESEGIRKE